MEEWKKNIKKKNPNGEILALLDKYGNDTKRALKGISLCPGSAEGKSVRVV